MGLAGGLAAQFGMAKETTFNVITTPTRFLEFNSETLKQTIERIESGGMRPGRRVLREKQWQAAREAIAGDVEFDFQTNGMGLMLQAMIGPGASAQPNAGSFPTVFQQTYKIGQLDGYSFTSQVAFGDTGGTVRALTFGGCKVPKWTLEASEKGYVKLKPSIDGASGSVATALASATYASTTEQLNYTGTVLKIAGTEQVVQKIVLSCDNAQKVDRYGMRGTTPQQKREQLESGLRKLTGSLDMEVENLTTYKRFTEGTMGELVMTFGGAPIAGTFSNGLEVKLATVRFDGETPVVPGPGIISVTAPFVGLDNGAGAGGLEAIYTTTDNAV